MRIGELARRSGVTCSRIRFYEGRGLLPAASRRDNGYRDYAPSMVAISRFIQDAQSLGFSLREIGEALPAMKSPRVGDAIVPALEKKLADVEAHIHAAKALRGRLLKLIEEQKACCTTG